MARITLTTTKGDTIYIWTEHIAWVTRNRQGDTLIGTLDGAEHAVREPLQKVADGVDRRDPRMPD
jgi:hypothetical protein